MKILLQSKKIKIAVSLLAVLLIIGSVMAFITYKRYMNDPISPKDFVLYIYPTTTQKQVMERIQEEVSLKEVNRLKQLFRLKKFDPAAKPGAYRIDSTMSAVDVYRMLSRGLQTPVKFTFNNIRTKQQFADRVGEQLMMSADSILALISDSAVCRTLGFTVHSIPAMFIPDTYEMYWTISPRKFLSRMKKEYDAFWTDTRMTQAANAGLSPQEVATLASVVSEETNATEEIPIVAGLYLNRIKRGIPLQADPTIKFALQDFEIRRILLEYLAIESPYNTYKYTGLPPGPIRFVSKSLLDATLNYDKHDYLYMCAKEDFSGRHNFARTLSEHNRNAAQYHRALNQRKIFK